MIIKRNIVEAIFAQAEQGAPIEVCGYLAGDSGRVTRFYAMRNVDGKADHFSFDPKEQFDVHKSARQEGMRIIGVYHSHPVTPARPSLEDIRMAYDPAIVYVIVSLMGGVRTIRGFHITQGKVEDEPLITEEEQ